MRTNLDLDITTEDGIFRRMSEAEILSQTAYKLHRISITIMGLMFLWKWILKWIIVFKRPKDILYLIENIQHGGSTHMELVLLMAQFRYNCKFF